MDGNALLSLIDGGSLALEPGDVYVLGVVVPEDEDSPIVCTTNVIGGLEEEDDIDRLAEALRVMGEHSHEIVETHEAAEELRNAS